MPKLIMNSKQVNNNENITDEYKTILYAESQHIVIEEFYNSNIGTVKSSKDNYLKATYNIDTEDLENLYKAQEGKCAICEQAKPMNELVVDHEHSHEDNSGQVRGLLCSPCNLMLGHGKDKIKTFVNAAKYIEKSHYYCVIVPTKDGEKFIKLKRGRIPEFRPNSLLTKQ